MSKLISGSRVYGNLTVNNSVIAAAGAGFQNIVPFTSGTGVSYSLPSQLTAGAKFKLTMVGGGGGGAGFNTSSASLYGAGGGGSGGVLVLIITVVSGVTSLTYTIGSAGSGGATTGGNGTDTIVVYNGITYTAGGGAGAIPAASFTFTVPAAGGTNSCTTPSLIAMTNGLTNALNIPGFPGRRSGGEQSAAYHGSGFGGNTPLGWGQGGIMLGSNSGAARNGQPGTGYGSGGSGASFASTSGTGTGGAGAGGIIIFEY